MLDLDSEFSEQMMTTLITERDVVAAFKLFLNRLPHQAEDLTPLCNTKSDVFLRWIMDTPEFLNRVGTDALILNITKRIQDLEKLKAG